MVSFAKVLSQQFSLPKPIIRYLLKNATIKFIKKLQKTCRYLYSKFNFDIIDNLFINCGYYYGELTEISNYNLRIPQNKLKLFKNKFYLCKKLHIHDRDITKILYPKIIKCEITELITSFITINDFALLTKLGKNLQIVYITGKIFCSDNTSAPLEDILSYIPNVYDFSYSECTVTSNTMIKLFSLKRNVKFCRLALTRVNNFLDPYLFNEYIKNMFDFESPLIKGPEVELMGSQNALGQIYELVKTWRKDSMYFDWAGYMYIR